MHQMTRGMYASIHCEIDWLDSQMRRTPGPLHLSPPSNNGFTEVQLTVSPLESRLINGLQVPLRLSDNNTKFVLFHD